MAKVKILTPVHIGDGETIEAPCFQQVGTQVNRYRLSDLFEQLPVSKIMDPKFLDGLRRGPSSKSSFYAAFDQINYQKIQPLYSVSYEWEGLEKRRDVASQVKDFDKPYIPGSTLKGAIENALNFAILLTFFEKRRDQIRYSLNELRKLTEGYMLKLVFGDPQQKADDFMKEVYGCILCSDLYFDHLEVNDAIRYHVYKDQEMPPEVPECIASGQESSIEQLIQLDQCKIKQLEEGKWPKEYKRILSLLTPAMIAKACNRYTYEMLKAEQTEDLEDFYCDFEPINRTLNQIKNGVKACSQIPNRFYLRVGMHTNYFAKTVSFFFKEKMPEVYKEEFQTLFAPVRGGKIHPDAEKMPITRTILYNEEEGNMLAGFVQVDL